MRDLDFFYERMGKSCWWVGRSCGAGLVVMLVGKANLPLGRLPGDLLYRGKNTVFYFPLATSILF